MNIIASICKNVEYKREKITITKIIRVSATTIHNIIIILLILDRCTCPYYNYNNNNYNNKITKIIVIMRASHYP